MDIRWFMLEEAYLQGGPCRSHMHTKKVPYRYDFGQSEEGMAYLLDVIVQRRQRIADVMLGRQPRPYTF